MSNCTARNRAKKIWEVFSKLQLMHGPQEYLIGDNRPWFIELNWTLCNVISANQMGVLCNEFCIGRNGGAARRYIRSDVVFNGYLSKLLLTRQLQVFVLRAGLERSDIESLFIRCETRTVACVLRRYSCCLNTSFFIRQQEVLDECFFMLYSNLLATLVLLWISFRDGRKRPLAFLFPVSWNRRR